MLLAVAVRQAQLGGKPLVFSCRVVAKALGFQSRVVAIWREEYAKAGVLRCTRPPVSPLQGRGRAAEFLVIADSQLVADVVEALAGFQDESVVRANLAAARAAAQPTPGELREGGAA